MPWNDGLAGVALNIAATDESPLRVMAGPGTGKSFAMMRRVSRLLEEGVDPRRILAVTFTRTAAAGLVNELRALNVPGCERINAGTLHSFCFQLLNQDEVLELSGRHPRPVVTFQVKKVLQFEGRTLLLDLIRMGDFGALRDCSARIRAFEAAWARLQSDDPGWPLDPVDAQFHDLLVEWLKFHRAILVGELVPLAFNYLRDNPACDARSAFDHVIVDEYQDLNRAEQELIDLLAQKGSTAIVGDVDQSIYRFRHANPEGIEGFANAHPMTHDERLKECRRCPKEVVAVADYLIRRNYPGVVVPRLSPRAANLDGHIRIVQWDTLNDEANGICDFVLWLVDQKGYLPGDILILTPRRLIGYSIRDCISENGIPVHSFYHEEALEPVEAQRAFALLTLLVDPEDRVALRWWLGDDSSTGRVGPYAHLRNHCEATGMSPRDSLEALRNGSLSMPKVDALVGRYDELLAALAPLRGLKPADLVEVLFPEGDDNCKVLREAALLALDADTKLDKLFSRIRSSITQPELPSETDFVRVMSLHKSKGLTSKIAIIAGCIQGLLPVEDGEEPPAEQIEILREQRRLFYVAITRCTERLVISSARSIPRAIAFAIGARITSNRDPITAMTSQFISELGPSRPAARAGHDWQAEDYA